jgi:prolyl-tRNA synthetase
MSHLFVRTLRDDPADAEVPSHRWLVRAGYVRRVSPGVYTWLPLGKRVLEAVATVVREEMDRIGAQEVLFPALLPRELYETTGRWTEYGDNIFRLQDRKGADHLLGPTHEELFTTLVKGELSSYRDYPVILYQIQTKYRDEARPRAGLLRGREFVMKDSYSFDLDDAGLQQSYDRHRVAYQRIFERLGLDYRIAFAVSGAMGGSASEEFLAPAEYGEDTFVQCTSCDYTANTEAVEIAVPSAVAAAEQEVAGQDGSAHPAALVLDTPDTPTIDTLVAKLNQLSAAGQLGGRSFTGSDTLKNVVLKTRDPGTSDWQLLVVGVPCDRDVDLKRIAGQLEPTEVAQADADDLAKEPKLVRGYIGPQLLADIGVRYLVDPLVAPGSAWVTGANEPDRHAAFVVRGRDFEPAGEIGAVEIRDGDRCARCGSALTIARGIEIGHIFQLGRKYADAFGLDAQGPDGEAIRITMGSYGVGVSRAVAAIAEQTGDEHGLSWPASVAPYDVHLVPVGKGEEQLRAAEQIAQQLADAGRRVLLDDRQASAGEKFADADLLGMPTIVVVGKSLADGEVEVKDRRTGERRKVAVDAVVAELA